MISDEELTAWLDGELSAQETGAIKRALAEDTDLAARLEALTLDKSTLRDAFGPLLDKAPADLCAAVAPVRLGPARSPVALAVAASALLAVGLGAGWALFSPPVGWQVEVAHYQALYVADTMAPVNGDPARIAAELAVAGARLGLELDADALDGFDGLTLRRAQVLGYEGQVLVQIAYTSPTGMPVAFCILQKTTPGDSGLKSEILSGLATTNWQSGRHGFLTIGGQDAERMRSFAAYLRGVL